MTDLERADDLDHLTSDELEERVFGPAPKERRSIRGLVDRPASGAVTYRVKETKRRWPVLLGGLVAFVVAFIAVDVFTESGPGIFYMAEGSAMEAEMEAVMEAEMEAAMEARMEAMEAATEARAEAMEARAEAMEAAAEARAEALEAAAEARAEALEARVR